MSCVVVKSINNIDVLKQRYLNYLNNGVSYEIIECDIIKQLNNVRLCPTNKTKKHIQIDELLRVLMWVIEIQQNKKNILYG